MYFQMIPFPPKIIQAFVRCFLAEKDDAISKASDIKSVALISLTHKNKETDELVKIRLLRKRF